MAYICVPAPAVEENMEDWIKLGGKSLGICPDEHHKTGFHVPGGNVPKTDYSRSHEVPPPFDLHWACAGDYAHNGNSALRARHAVLLGRLMKGDPTLSHVCEFIGQPWADRPVYYWARWNGITTLKKYTGSGHDRWSHISVWRSKANIVQRLWTPAPVVPTVPPTPQKPVVIPAWPGRFIQYRKGWNSKQRYRGADVRKWQQKMKERGWKITVDGDFGADSDRILRAFQEEKGLRRDGILGPISWKTTWTAKVTKS